MSGASLPASPPGCWLLSRRENHSCPRSLTTSITPPMPPHATRMAPRGPHDERASRDRARGFAPTSAAHQWFFGSLLIGMGAAVPAGQPEPHRSASGSSAIFWPLLILRVRIVAAVLWPGGRTRLRRDRRHLWRPVAGGPAVRRRHQRHGHLLAADSHRPRNQHALSARAAGMPPPLACAAGAAAAWAPPLGSTSGFTDSGTSARAAREQSDRRQATMSTSRPRCARSRSWPASSGRNVSQAFRGGSITAVMGNVEIDLRDSRMSDSGASIAIQVIMGQTVLRLPRDWAVESHLATVLGNLEDTLGSPGRCVTKRLDHRWLRLLGPGRDSELATASSRASGPLDRPRRRRCSSSSGRCSARPSACCRSGGPAVSSATAWAAALWGETLGLSGARRRPMSAARHRSRHPIPGACSRPSGWAQRSHAGLWLERDAPGSGRCPPSAPSPYSVFGTMAMPAALGAALVFMLASAVNYVADCWRRAPGGRGAGAPGRDRRTRGRTARATRRKSIRTSCSTAFIRSAASSAATRRAPADVHRAGRVLSRKPSRRRAKPNPTRRRGRPRPHATWRSSDFALVIVLACTWNCDEGARDATVPPLLLQPLAENAVRHGIATLVDGGTVTIESDGETEDASR